MMYYGWDNMMGFGYAPFGWIGAVLMFVFWALIIAGVVILLKRLTLPPEKEKKDDSAMEILKERYAKGEINREEFERMKKDLK